MKSRSIFGALASVHALPALAPVVPAVARAYRVETTLADRSRVALTFDDGPHPEGTPATLRILEDAGARATFFLAGEQVERWPALAAEIAAAGHEVGLHCQRHRNQLRLAPRQIAEDMRFGADAIRLATGVEPALHRPPYGIYSAGGLRAARKLGYRPLLWSQWGRDWARRATPGSIAAKVNGSLAGGDIVLLHDADHYSAPGSWERTVAALPLILEAVAERGLAASAVGSD
jgi:peptidoglycan/xylan/chitin deacetylase (PgdA/CDA1 family)